MFDAHCLVGHRLCCGEGAGAGWNHLLPQSVLTVRYQRNVSSHTHSASSAMNAQTIRTGSHKGMVTAKSKMRKMRHAM